MNISVVICSRTPNEDYLRRVLAALAAQTLPRDQWELLLIDNASSQPLAANWDLSWHPCGRHIREEQLGTTAARLRGIAESTGEIIVFVDDDNVLHDDYLALALGIAERWPMLGIWGGQTIGEFASRPPAWIGPYQSMLAVYAFEQDRWSNQMDDACLPATAGGCLRRSVARQWSDSLENDPIRAQLLGRRGEAKLTAGEDTDMGMFACKIGFGTGRFAALKLRHLIPERRLTEDYLVRLAEAMSFTDTILRAIYGRGNSVPNWKRRLANVASALFANRRERRFRLAALAGRREAEASILANPSLSRRA